MKAPVSTRSEERRNEILRSNGPTASPPGHVVRLRHRMEFDRNIARPGDLEDARRPVSVECHLRVGVVIHQQDIEFPAPRYNSLQILPGRNSGGGIVGIIEIKNPRSSKNVLWDAVKLDEKIVLRFQAIPIRLSLRELGTSDIREISRLRDNRDVVILDVSESD